MNMKHNSRALPRSSNTHHDKLYANAETEENMWSSMLDGVASGKRLPEKNILVLGGNPESQKDFLKTIRSDSGPKRPQERQRKKPPIANEFALGYTYQDVLDSDHEDILARLSIYLLCEPSTAFAPLTKPLLTSRMVPHTLVVLLLDWAEPWMWVRQLRDWVLFLKEVVSSLDEETRDIMELYMKEWQQRRRGGAHDAGGSGMNDAGVELPLSSGEWDESLGLPICVVCHSADKIETLEKEHGWREERFDFVLQFLRTILMKREPSFLMISIPHFLEACLTLRLADGASLIYTSISVPNSLPILIHSMLGVYSLFKKQNLKHNVIDRDKVLIPPSWDSWGKIRVLREGFDVEGISQSWSVDVRRAPLGAAGTTEKRVTGLSQPKGNAQEAGIISAYEEVIKDPRGNDEVDSTGPSHGIEIPAVNTQEFLAGQLEIMERLKAEDEKGQDAKSSKSSSDRPGKTATLLSNPLLAQHPGRVDEHIGPVQFNFGGIQVDSDGMAMKQKHQAEQPQVPEKDAKLPNTPDRQNETLKSFFDNLIERGGTKNP